MTGTGKTQHNGKQHRATGGAARGSSGNGSMVAARRREEVSMLTGMTGTTTRRTGELCGKRFAAYVEPAVITACGYYRVYGISSQNKNHHKHFGCPPKCYLGKPFDNHGGRWLISNGL